MKKTISNSRNFNTISKKSNALLTLLMSIYSLGCALPVLLVYIVSFSSEDSVMTNGYSYFPTEWSLAAYQSLLKSIHTIIRSYGVSIFATITGTLIGLFIMSLFAYVISRKDFKYHKILTFFAFFTMLFNGGLVASYLINTQVFHLSNTIWALILPYTINAYYVIIMRTFFSQTIPDSVIESARIDGAGELQIYYSIILPLSKPVLATIGLFLIVVYWNDWFLGLLYITDDNLVSIQYSLMKIQASMEFIKSNMVALGGEASSLLKGYPTETARMAMLVVVITPVMFAYPFFQRYFVSGLTIGSIKG
ncbi:carbohydrate ABC transporter permease [Vallitalea okinawensis]|uniref:carbohydrate ABC transporter permease n=1 Tax=Vallitalea okinawensis TaxID=2078660 RepID=UPI001FA8B9DA|nr:carbohydrate ABC transporter permease [Vallitalea okinawensis]